MPWAASHLGQLWRKVERCPRERTDRIIGQGAQAYILRSGTGMHLLDEPSSAEKYILD